MGTTVILGFLKIRHITHNSALRELWFVCVHHLEVLKNSLTLSNCRRWSLKCDKKYTCTNLNHGLDAHLSHFKSRGIRFALKWSKVVCVTLFYYVLGNCRCVFVPSYVALVYIDFICFRANSTHIVEATNIATLAERITHRHRFTWRPIISNCSPPLTRVPAYLHCVQSTLSSIQYTLCFWNMYKSF